MKPIQKKKGIIINCKDYKENSKIITIITESGCENVLLKGASKLSSGNKKYTIFPVEVDYIVAKSSTISTFTQGYVVNNFTNIKSDINKNLAMLVILEKVLAFFENIDDFGLFYEFLRKTLYLLDEFDYYKVIVNIFEVKLLYLLGIAPNVKECLLCGKKNNVALNIELGGGICEKCSYTKGFDLNPQETQIYEYLYYVKLEKIDEKFLELVNNANVNLDKFIDRYYEKYISFFSKTKKIIKKVS